MWGPWKLDVEEGPAAPAVPCSKCGNEVTSIREEHKHPALAGVARAGRTLMLLAMVIVGLVAYSMVESTTQPGRDSPIAGMICFGTLAVGFVIALIDGALKALTAKRRVRHCPRCGAFHEIL